MKKYRFMIVLFALTWFGCAIEVRTQSVYSYSDIYYYEPTNSILAVAEAFPDYPTDLYYCLSVMGPVYKDGAEAGWVGGDNMDPVSGNCGGWATADMWLPYDPNAEYEVLSHHSVQAMYRHFNEARTWMNTTMPSTVFNSQASISQVGSIFQAAALRSLVYKTFSWALFIASSQEVHLRDRPTTSK